MKKIEVITPDHFEADNHFYPKALNAQLHPMVSHFFNLDHERVAKRYTHLNPQVDKAKLEEILKYQSKHFYWGGADLFYVTTESGRRRMVVLETNSCPSGQKSMPPRSDSDDYRGYRYLIENSFLPLLKKKRLPKGSLAVIYDKNYMEVSGYASTLADITGECVYLIPHMDNEEQYIHFDQGVMQLNYNGQQVPIRAAYRYVTQKPWNRIPVTSKTFIYNSTLVCLAGGRNKLLANKAYEFYNSELASSGLKINMPETIKDVSKLEIPLWVQKFGGKAVIKNPYSNAGQGVYTITDEKELNAFLSEEHSYDQFIVQSLIGHYNWSSTGTQGRFFHVGTVPNKKKNIYIADIRMMIYSTPNGFIPCAIYARRAKSPLNSELKTSSWDVLGTNLSIKKGENQWESDVSRLMLMDRKDFNALGVGIDDLIEAYIQTVLSVIAIDKMAQNLINKKGLFRQKLFTSLDNDKALLSEIMYS
ncbi:MAG: hypothetical protein CME62_00595 [Halobacteriovoraceae bacterium]|nr:hypothetical protein [Halobacteriovoraceae bacterium]|tara:strand:- start:2371 stop:3795 length:1425 start_codon:yes stop_codon:yes gene_type:complete